MQVLTFLPHVQTIYTLLKMGCQWTHLKYIPRGVKGISCTINFDRFWLFETHSNDSNDKILPARTVLF